MLSAENHFKNQVDICAFSMAYRAFDLSVESQNSIDSRFLMKGKNAVAIPYQVAVSLNDRPKQSVIQSQWVSGGVLKKAKSKTACQGYNARIYLGVLREDLHLVPAGTYKDTMTVKVKGR